MVPSAFFSSPFLKQNFVGCSALPGTAPPPSCLFSLFFLGPSFRKGGFSATCSSPETAFPRFPFVVYYPSNFRFFVPKLKSAKLIYPHKGLLFPSSVFIRLVLTTAPPGKQCIHLEKSHLVILQFVSPPVRFCISVVSHFVWKLVLLLSLCPTSLLLPFSIFYSGRLPPVLPPISPCDVTMTWVLGRTLHSHPSFFSHPSFPLG